MLCIEDSLIEAKEDGTAMLLLSNPGKTTHLLKEGEELGNAYEANMVNPPEISA